MITVAVSIAAEQVRAIDRVLREERRRLGTRASRSGLVRKALEEYLAKHARELREERDRMIVAKHKRRLAREAAALTAEQAPL
jgi:metal-responsive CopG/Arc/MetJ family transcriptional regulator